jgi:uncharacterized protein (DUF1800 family)
MSDTPKTAPTDSLWTPYSPGKETPWNLRRVAHLHRRAGFAATWGEIQRDLRDGPTASIDRLLTGKAEVPSVSGDFARTADLLGESAVAANDPARLKAWWMYRMLFGPDPLTERLTLLWHNHFATSNNKVADLTAMHRQNALFRALGRGRFGDMLNKVVRDPALLLWLDAPANRKEHPNENLGRELMELFTLGIGPYSEKDVKEAARALTGWTVDDDGRFQQRPNHHDDGKKTILGRKGKWTGDDLVNQLLEHPATSERLADRLCGLFLGEGAASAAEVAALAHGLRARQLDIGWAVETILRSQTFFADAHIGNRVVGPVEYVVNAARALEMFDPAPSTLVLADWAARLGQDLFYPPNVGGWPGGRAWISTRSVVGRANYAAALVGGDKVGRPPFDALTFAQRHGRGRDLDDTLMFFGELLLGTSPTLERRARLVAALEVKRGTDADTARRAVAVILASPEAQLA